MAKGSGFSMGFIGVKWLYEHWVGSSADTMKVQPTLQDYIGYIPTAARSVSFDVCSGWRLW
eukprot:10509043-Karenia_brevis.AAC.1